MMTQDDARQVIFAREFIETYYERAYTQPGYDMLRSDALNLLKHLTAALITEARSITQE